MQVLFRLVITYSLRAEFFLVSGSRFKARQLVKLPFQKI